MTLAQVHGVVLSGVTGAVIRVEVDVGDGLPGVGVVGLPDTSVAEARWRARCAIESIGGTWPTRRITISLAPAELRKHGAGLDLPIAIGVLTANGALAPVDHRSTAFIGELGLDGQVRPVRGALAGALAVRDAGIRRVVVPSSSAVDLACLRGVDLVVADHLSEVVGILAGTCTPGAVPSGPPSSSAAADGVDLRDVRGHAHARLALEVAAAGGHHVALIGAPGVGKSMLADRLPGLLPDLSEPVALEVAAIHALAPEPRLSTAFRRPPHAAPHHSASAAAVLGSVHGARVVPGSVSLAHHGVLILDEAPEFARPVLEGLRQPLESGRLAIARSGWSGVLPAAFQLILTANPCPCGRRIGSGAECSCSSATVRRYAARLSGPVMDRIDIRLVLARPSTGEWGEEPGEDSSTVRVRVEKARQRAEERFAGRPWQLNARLPAGELRRAYPPDAGGAELLRGLERAATSLRGPDRVLRMAWTLADLRGRDRPGADEVATAAALRGAGTAWST